ncbi:MAG: tRNA (N(6)-L-threonylcarbamoyladenosine(37)-C(2))-methylthiotransferase MtaB [Dorea sp.]|jgi:threonylcarbamoyladenosine tRNA methylthiotransferase MtaB|nr:tRNA (N(6)-L-threonylcarbamoyladenosine(37)-C(2))-methylthiotransferase MtaB [Dorea sp.]
MRKAALHNLGCKVNAYESEAMQELLEENGYEIVPFGESADVYVINTCTVTNMADRKSRQMIHKARKLNPDAAVVAAGCYVQTRGGEADDGIDIMIGNNRKKDLILILEEYFQQQDVKKQGTLLEAGRVKSGSGTAGNVGRREVYEALADIGKSCGYEELSLSRQAEHTRAIVKVQDGCNQFCSYCIIPYARGRVRSRGLAEVEKEVRRLAENGYKEVVLTGIHLSSYGVDTGGSLLSLLRAVHQTEGILRIRLGSLEPGIITEEFAAELAALPKICPHFHLSLQSGCNATLKRMNRKYTAEEYEEKCGILRKTFVDPAITTDIIVGFPGETEEEFQESRAFIDRVNFYETHIFKYSKRQGTRAAEMEGQVPEPVKAERSGVLIAMGKQKRQEYEAKLIGRTVEVLVEEETMFGGERFLVGHTKEYVKVRRKYDENLTNQLINVEIQNRLQIMD